MDIALLVTAGPANGERINLGPREVLRVGSSSYADMSINDEAISGIHFEIRRLDKSNFDKSRPATEFRICDFHSRAGTFVNRSAVAEARLKHGDQIHAGQSTFTVCIQTTQTLPPTASHTTAAEPIKNPSHEADAHCGFIPAPVGELAGTARLESPRSRSLAQQLKSPADFVHQLVSEGLLADAMRFLAWALVKRRSVWWAITCVRFACAVDAESPEDHALKLAEQWVRRPGEDSRRAAMQAVQAADLGHAANWPALAAFWSCGSLAPADTPEVAADDELTGKATWVAASLAAVSRQPELADQKRQRFIEFGMAIARGELLWNPPVPELISTPLPHQVPQFGIQ